MWHIWLLRLWMHRWTTVVIQWSYCDWIGRSDRRTMCWILWRWAWGLSLRRSWLAASARCRTACHCWSTRARDPDTRRSMRCCLVFGRPWPWCVEAGTDPQDWACSTWGCYRSDLAARQSSFREVCGSFHRQQPCWYWKAPEQLYVRPL